MPPDEDAVDEEGRRTLHAGRGAVLEVLRISDMCCRSPGTRRRPPCPAPGRPHSSSDSRRPARPGSGTGGRGTSSRLALVVGALAGLGGLHGVGVKAGEREVAVDEANAVAVVTQYLGQRLRVEAGAVGTLEIAELYDGNGGVFGPLGGVVVHRHVDGPNGGCRPRGAAPSSLHHLHGRPSAVLIEGHGVREHAQHEDADGGESHHGASDGTRQQVAPPIEPQPRGGPRNFRLFRLALGGRCLAAWPATPDRPLAQSLLSPTARKRPPTPPAVAPFDSSTGHLH